MNSFYRYTIHFLWICYAILVLLGLYGLINSLPFYKSVVITLVISVTVCSILGGAIFSSMADQKQVVFNCMSQEDKDITLKEVKKILSVKLKKIEINSELDKYIFSEKSKYSRWLTNPTIIENKKNTIIVTTPSVYVQHFKALQKSLTK